MSDNKVQQTEVDGLVIVSAGDSSRSLRESTRDEVKRIAKIFRQGIQAKEQAILDLAQRAQSR